MTAPLRVQAVRMQRTGRVRRGGGTARQLKRLWPRRWLARALLLLLLVALIPPAVLLPGRWLPVVRTSFMLQAHVRALTDGQAHPSFARDWEPWERLSPYLKRAVLTAEDQRFYLHSGLDIEAMRKAWRHNKGHKRIRGGSTISQQLAKNLFLWPGRSYIRKGLEAYCTLWMELLWPKQRILEVYLNVVEFGDNTYGAEAAAQRYFGKPASALNGREAALMAAVLPAPRRMKLNAPSGYMQRRAGRIQRMMVGLPEGADE